MHVEINWDIENTNMFKLTVTGISEAALYAPSHTKIIGIIDPNTKPIETDKPYHVEYFHDIEIFLNGYQRANIKNVEQILNFSKTFTDDDNVLIHCHAGISRSTAIAILVLVQHGMSIEDAFDHVYEIRDCMSPNSLLIEFGDCLLDCDGELAHHYYEWIDKEKIKYERFAGQNNTQHMKDILKMFKK